MITIKVKFIPATNTKPPRIKADDGDGNSITINRTNSDKLNYGQEAMAAAKILCNKMSWDGEKLIGGCYKDEYYFNFSNSWVGQS